MKKRIALSVVAALAGSLLVAGSASADTANSAADHPFYVANAQSTSSATAATAAATETATAYLSTATTTRYVQIVADAADTTTVGSFLSVTGGTFASTTKGTLSADSTKITFTSTALETATARILMPATAGTIVVTYTKVTDSNGSITSAVKQTITISAVAAPVSVTPVYTHSTLGTTDTNTVTSGYRDAAGVLYATKGTGGGSVIGIPGTVVAHFDVKQWTSETETVATDATTSKAVTVSLSGVGSLSLTNDTTTASTYAVVAAGDANGIIPVYVANDGRAGTAEITVAVNGVTVGTKVVKFYGAAAHYATTVSTVNNVQANNTDTATVTVKVTDASGIAVPGLAGSLTPYTSETLTAGLGSVVESSVKGTYTYTVKTATKGLWFAGYGDGVETSTATINFVTAGIDTITATTDAATYLPGAKVTFTISAVNSDGVAVGDTYTVLAADAVSNTGLTSAPAVNAPLHFVAGKSSDLTAYAPLAEGTVTVTLKVGAKSADVSFVVANPSTASLATAVAAAQAAAVKAGTDAVAASKAASDAAVAAANAAATAAAKAGTDAVAAAATAKIAADAAAAAAAKAGVDAAAAAAAAGVKADAATAAAKAASDAVAALSTSVASLQTTVASLVASMTAQIKVINSSMLKIAKKLGIKI